MAMDDGWKEEAVAMCRADVLAWPNAKVQQ
jgi:hypothetical protein